MLNDKQIKNLKPAEKDYKKYDAKGLFILVRPNGSKLWRFNYKADGKYKTKALGAYPEVSLAAARKLVWVEQSKQSEQPKHQDTNRGITVSTAFEFWARQYEWSEKRAAYIHRLYDTHIKPSLGDRDISTVSTPDLFQLLSELNMKQSATAGKVKTLLSGVFQYAMLIGFCPDNPVRKLAGALKSKKTRHRSAITNNKELATLLRCIDTYHGKPKIRIYMQLLPLVFTRPGELLGLRLSEVDWDTATWTIPAARMKMSKEHIVPLSTQAIALLREAQSLNPESDAPFANTSLANINRAYRVMGFSADEVSAHGFRATARTLLDEVLEYDPRLIESQLAHSVRDTLGRAYNRTGFIKQRREMMQQWGDYLDMLKGGVANGG